MNAQLRIAFFINRPKNEQKSISLFGLTLCFISAYGFFSVKSSECCVVHISANKVQTMSTFACVFDILFLTKGQKSNSIGDVTFL